MTAKLTDMVIEEISIVDDPANEAARVEIVKAKAFKPCAGCKTPDECTAKRQCQSDVSKGKSKTFDDAMKRQSERSQAYKMFDDIYKATDALRSAIMGAIEDDDEDDRPAVVGKNIDAFVEYVKGMAPTILAKARAGDGDDPAASAAQLQEMEMDIEQLTKALEDAEGKLAELEKRATDAETLAKSKDTEIAELKKSAGGQQQTEEDFMKSLPAAVRERIEKSEREAREASEAIAKMKDESETRESIAKAKDAGLPDPDKTGPLLRRVAKGMTTADDAAALESMLKAVTAQAATGNLYKSLGTQVPEGTDPEAMLKSKAEEIRKAKPELSPEQAYTQAVDQNPDLYTAYVAKRRA